jgi:hypothetical protein
MPNELKPGKANFAGGWNPVIPLRAHLFRYKNGHSIYFGRPFYFLS